MLREAAIGLSAGRIALGAGLLAAPTRIAAGWIGAPAARPEARAIARSVGARDLVLGAGATVALLNGSEEAPLWLAGGAACDLADIGATIAARESLPRSGVAVVLALGGASALLCALAANGERK